AQHLARRADGEGHAAAGPEAEDGVGPLALGREPAAVLAAIEAARGAGDPGVVAPAPEVGEALGRAADRRRRDRDLLRRPGAAVPGHDDAGEADGEDLAGARPPDVDQRPADAARHVAPVGAGEVEDVAAAPD